MSDAYANGTDVPSVPRSVCQECERLRAHHKCWYCGESLLKDPPERITIKPINWGLFPPNFTDHPVHLQHDHHTGMTEGAVHAYCNAVLWQYHGR